MKYFWLKFGRADAHSLAEARRAAVSVVHNFLVSVTFLLRAFLFTFGVLSAGLTEGWGATGR